MLSNAIHGPHNTTPMVPTTPSISQILPSFLTWPRPCIMGFMSLDVPTTLPRALAFYLVYHRRLRFTARVHGKLLPPVPLHTRVAFVFQDLRGCWETQKNCPLMMTDLMFTPLPLGSGMSRTLTGYEGLHALPL